MLKVISWNQQEKLSAGKLLLIDFLNSATVKPAISANFNFIKVFEIIR